MSEIPESLDALRVPVDGLLPYPRNPRRGDVSRIVESLRTNGQYRLIVVNSRTNEVLAGNHTLAAVRELGWPEVAVTYVDADEEQAARIALIDNRASDVAGYDDRLLAELLDGLPDLAGTGYTQPDLDALLASIADPAAPDDFQDPEDGLEVEFQCPACGYEWSGLPSSSAAGNGDEG